uniref:melanoma antigen preferentially expressed in tumors-like n=1 Tax=Jaculus jaculus TaxID=51337 RepID=UPI000332FA3B|nr:melanoma antigen preferentially expressed in tumors-like [Jaculus jaculus]
MKMEKKDPATLLELAIQGLLSNESAAIHALEEIPRELFIPLFNAAFKGEHKKILEAMVKIWPFFCLHIGTLKIKASHFELLKAMVDSLQFIHAQNSASRTPKLRILDLRQGIDCRTTCPEISRKSPICLHSCDYSEQSILKIESQFSHVHSNSEIQSTKQAMELIVDLSLKVRLKERGFLLSVSSKVHQSLGSLHVCCRDLKIDASSDYRSIVEILDLLCLQNLAIEKASLSEVTNLLCQIENLDRLSLSKITIRSLNIKIFRCFLRQLRRLDNLEELNLSSFCLTNNLENLLRVLQPTLEYLSLCFCEFSHSDFTFLSQYSEFKYLKLLNLSHNSMFLGDCENIRILLENISGTLKHLAINHCFLTDSTISVLLPALSHCYHLRMFSFASNPITMSMLLRIVQHLTPLMELKYVIYPIPLHCYNGWYFNGNLDPEKLTDVRAQVKRTVKESQREDMNWLT